VYDTPTPGHADAPHVYPEGFLESYRAAMHQTMTELNIEYYDLIDLFPWSGVYMNDFLHPSPKARRDIHQLLLCTLFGGSGDAPAPKTYQVRH
jgi:hypothetical protein